MNGSESSCTCSLIALFLYRGWNPNVKATNDREDVICTLKGEGGEGVGNEIETKTDAYKTKLHFGKAMRIAQLLIGEGRKTGFHTAHQYDEPVYSQAFYTV